MYHSTHFSIFHFLQLPYSLCVCPPVSIYVLPVGLEWHCVDSLCLVFTSQSLCFIYILYYYYYIYYTFGAILFSLGMLLAISITGTPLYSSSIFLIL